MFLLFLTFFAAIRETKMATLGIDKINMETVLAKVSLLYKFECFNMNHFVSTENKSE